MLFLMMLSISITLKIFSCKVFTESKFAFYSVVLHFIYRTQLKEWTVKSAADILNDNKQAKTRKQGRPCITSFTKNSLGNQPKSKPQP